MFRLKHVSWAALAVCAGGIAPLAVAQQQQLERVEITGSSIRRVDAEAALPVQVVTKEEIARTGATSTEQLLQTISAMSSQGGINNATGAGNSTYGQSSISLRGLGEDRTLVLVNGRRLAAFAGGNGGSININAIPLAAIEKVEILKDGASAVYGSDAIAGVVNFILTKDFKGVDLSATVGKPTRSGGGESARASIVAGFGDRATNRFNVTLSASFEKERPLFAKDRNFAKTGNVPPYLAAAATGQGNIEGAYYPVAETPTGGTPGRQPGFGNSPGTGFGNPLALQNQCESINMFRDASQTVDVRTDPPTNRFGPFCSYDSNKDVGLIPKRDLATFSGNLTFDVTDNLQLFGDVLYSHSTVIQEFQPSPLRRSFMVTDAQFAAQGVEPVLLIRPTNPNYQIAADYLAAMEAAHPGLGYGDLIGQPLAVTARVFDFGNRTSKDVSKQSRLVGGAKGTFANQDWEVALAQNENKVSGTVPNGYFSQVAFARAVNDPNSDYNPWSLTQSAAFNAAAAAAKYTGATLNAKSQSTTADGKLSGEVVSLPAGPLLYAAGLQFRDEKLKLSPSEALLSGDIAGLGGATLPVDVSRKITSLFGELNAPIIKGLEVGAAVRNDDYNDVGNSTTQSARLRYQPIREVMFRTAYGTGFRAPTLRDLHDPVTLGTSEQFNDPATGQTDLQVNSFTGGNKSLKPEKSKQFGFGIVLQPTSNFNVSLDYFDIKVKDIIATPSAQEVVSRFRAGDPAFAGLVTLDANGDIDTITQTLQNLGQAKLKGVDIESSLKLNAGPGNVLLYLSGTYMTKFDQTSPGGAVSHKVGTIVDDNGDPVLSSNAVQDGVVLRWKHYLSATYSQGPWAFTLAQNFYKGYRDGNDLNGDEHRVPDQTIWDANVMYTWNKSLRLALGVKNLFDKDPPIYIPTSNQFQAGYDISLYDPRARFVYLTASYKF